MNKINCEICKEKLPFKIDVDGKTPIYLFPFLDQTKQTPYTRSYTPSSSIASRWQLQIGVRYLFN